MKLRMLLKIIIKVAKIIYRVVPSSKLSSKRSKLGLQQNTFKILGLKSYTGQHKQLYHTFQGKMTDMESLSSLNLHSSFVGKRGTVMLSSSITYISSGGGQEACFLFLFKSTIELLSLVKESFWWTSIPTEWTKVKN